jgi:hypothetical protein
VCCTGHVRLLLSEGWCGAGVVGQTMAYWAKIERMDLRNLSVLRGQSAKRRNEVSRNLLLEDLLRKGARRLRHIKAIVQVGTPKAVALRADRVVRGRVTRIEAA